MPGRAGAAIDRTSPEALFAFSGITQYVGAVVAVKLFDEAGPAAVALLRGLCGAVILALVAPWWRDRWSRADVGRAALFGAAAALMNLFFYLAIDRIPLGKSVVIEFIGPIALAAVLTRTLRNSIALVLAASGVALLSGVEVDSEPLGVVFILSASALWVAYIVLARKVAGRSKGTAGLGLSLWFGAAMITPVGAGNAGTLLTDGRLLALCFLVGLLSTVVPYGLDQYVLRRISTRRFAVMLALLPVTAMIVGFIALDQRPSGLDIAGALLVISGVVVQERDEPALEEMPAIDPA